MSEGLTVDRTHEVHTFDDDVVWLGRPSWFKTGLVIGLTTRYGVDEGFIVMGREDVADLRNLLSDWLESSP